MNDSVWPSAAPCLNITGELTLSTADSCPIRLGLHYGVPALSVMENAHLRLMLRSAYS